MIDWIIKIFRKERIEIIHDFDDPIIEEGAKFIWCLIGNITDKNSFGIDQKIKQGTKHFSANTKVYCLPAQWGDGYENIMVIGRHRKTNRNVCMVIPSKSINNWRIQKVYRPYILKVMKSQNGWNDSDEDKEEILKMAEALNSRKAKI